MSPYVVIQRCTFLGIDLQQFLDARIGPRLASFAGRIDAAVASHSVAEQAERAWAGMQEPVDLHNGRFLSLNPVTMGVGPFEARGGTRFNLSFGVEVAPTISSFVPTHEPQRALPAMTRVSGEPRFTLELDVAFPSTEIAEAVQTALGGSLAADGHRVEVRGVQVVPLSARHVAVGVDVGGEFTGVIWLEGDLDVLSEPAALRLTDVDFSVRTGNWIHQTATWMMHAEIRERLAQLAVYDLTQEIEARRSELAGSLQRGVVLHDATLTGTVFRVVPLDAFFTTRTGTELHVRLLADASVHGAIATGTIQ